MRCLEVEQYCENLGPDDYDQEDISPKTDDYNCIAYALGITDKKWWPSKRMTLDYDWPQHLPREDQYQETLDNFIRAFEFKGFRVCKSGKLRKQIEKVAIFVGPLGNPLHAARQLESGFWTSKCGDYEDIKHKSLSCIEGNNYGKVAVYLCRR